MGGVVLEHESKTIYNKGWMEGRMDAKQAIAMRLYERGTKPEEIAYINGFIGKEKLIGSAKAYGKSPYGEHLKAVAEGKVKY